MEVFRDLRIPMPGAFESPSLTRVGRFQRGIITSTLCCIPLLHAFQWHRGENSLKTGFRCRDRYGNTEISMDDDLAVKQRLMEYSDKYRVISPTIFLFYLVINLMVICLYMSYVSERFNAWFKLTTSKQRWKTTTELKSVSAVFTAHVFQLTWRLILTVSFVLYSCLAHWVVLPSELEYFSDRTVASFVFGDASIITICSSDQAFESSMFNIALLTFTVFCGILSLTELVYTWHETKGFDRISDYYFCMFLLRQNGVTGAINMQIQKELFLEKQKELINLIVEMNEVERLRFPLLSAAPGTSARFTNYSTIYICHRNIKYKGTKKHKHRHELFRTYSTKRRVPVKSLEDLIKPGGDSRNPRKILVTGEPGTGKTELTFQLTKTFGAGSSPERKGQRSFNFLFSFSFKELSLFRDNLFSLREFLSCSACSTKVGDTVYQHIVENPEEVLLIFDGLNEWDIKSSIEQAGIVKEKDGKMSTISLVLNIISGELLRGSVVVVTSRPTPLLSEMQEIIAFDRFVELGYFKPGRVRECVKEFFQDNVELGSFVSDRILGDENAKALCSVPQNCYLFCSCVEHEALSIRSQTDDRIENLKMPATTTELFERVFDLCTFNEATPDRCPLQKQVKKISQELINRLSRLAFQGIVNERPVFSRDDASFEELSASDVEYLVETGILQYLDGRNASSTQQSNFCFCQLTMQEFFAARRIVQSASVKEFRDFLEKANETHCMILQFVAGLCKDGNRTGANIFVCLLQHLTESIQINSFAHEPAIDHHGIVFLSKCLFENKSKLGHAFAREATSALKSRHIIFTDVGTGPQETQAILYCIREAMGENITKLTVESNVFGDFGLGQITSCVCDMTCKLERVNLTRSNITDDGMLSFLELSAGQCHISLRVLGLRGNGITSEGAKYLACVLFNDWCHLQEIHLGSNKIGDLGVQYFSEALCSDSCKIHTLDLSSNGITHNGLFYLSAALSNPSCSVRTLYLQKNKILDVGMEDLCEALCKDECNLRVLFASSNDITDRGIKSVEKALAHRSCNLQELYLGYNKVTDAGVKSLLQALPSHQVNLKVLSLANNPITEVGVKMLANALRNSSCNLSRLCISLGRSQAIPSTKASKLQVRYVNAF